MLSDVQARRMKPTDRPVAVGGVPGLMLFPAKRPGRGRFLLRYTSSEKGKRRAMGLGAYPKVGIAEARRLADQARALNRSGRDPIDARREPRPMTFFDYATAVLNDDLERVKQGRVTEQSVDRFSQTLHGHVLRKLRFATVSVGELTGADFADLLSPYWTERPALADRIRQICKRIIRRAAAFGAASMQAIDLVDELLPARAPYRDRVEHHPSMDQRDVPRFVASIGPLAKSSVAERALIFVILTGCRSGEVTGMRWDEFERPTSRWTIPAERMKNRRDHIVPLSRQCLEILKLQEDYYDGNELVFPSNRGGPLGSLLEPLRGLPSDVEGRCPTVHGFRATFMQWGIDSAEDFRLLDRCLSHDDKTKVERAYNRTPAIQRRRDILQRYADYVAPAGFGQERG